MTKRKSQLAEVPFFRRMWILFLAKVTPDCDRITRLASESLERPLTGVERLQLKFHFLICSWCKRYLAQLQTLHRCSCEIREYIPPEPGLSLSADEKQRLKQALRQDEKN